MDDKDVLPQLKNHSGRKGQLEATLKTDNFESILQSYK